MQVGRPLGLICVHLCNLRTKDGPQITPIAQMADSVPRSRRAGTSAGSRGVWGRERILV